MGKGSKLVKGGSWMSKHARNLLQDMPIDNRGSATPKMGSMKNDGMSKHGPLHDHHGAMKKIGSMRNDGMSKHGPLHDYGKPMNKMGYKK